MDSNILFNSLKVYHIDNKIRIGPKSDGGYVIVDGYEYDLFISCGIGDNNDFDIEITKKYPEIKCLSFDGTIDKLPTNSDKIEFIKKNIGTYNNNSTTNLNKYIDNYKNIFLAMDIEGEEYNWLNSLTDKQLLKFKQIIIEIHQPVKVKAGHCISIENRLKALNKLSRLFYLCHLHPNNCCGIKVIDGINIPNIFEATYIRKDKLKLERNSYPIPSKLDYKNVKDKDDIYLTGEPYQIKL
jgi:hypothetical protein